MKTKMRLLAVPALAVSALALQVGPAMAHDADTWSSQTTLNSVNNSGTTGTATVNVHGDEATVDVKVNGAAETFKDGPFPHAQHIHIAAQGVCPPPSADADGDGIVSTTEGHPFYGMIGTSLTTKGDTSADSALAVDRFPGGSSYNYERSFQLNPETAQSLKNGTAVVVVHGVDPTKLPAASATKPSDLDPKLPQAATAPAACGTLGASQMSAMPKGGADTGAQVTSHSNVATEVGVAGVAAATLAGASIVMMRRRAQK